MKQAWRTQAFIFMIHLSAVIRAFPKQPHAARRISKNPTRRQAHKIAVVGGGLAGLATTYHLLQQSASSGQNVEVTILDRAPVGTAGASSVAGGLVHPLSPRGKLVYRGLEGLAATNRLIDVAVQQQQQNNKNEAVVLRDKIYRVALSEKNVLQFQKTAVAHDEICEWVHPSNMDPSLQLGSDCLGYLKLTNGCKVIHIPTYLALLWRACEKSKRADWKLVENDNDLRNVSSSYDTVVLAAGSGLFESLIPQSMLPIQLVRGQSAIIKRPEESLTRSEAILCGKYISPLPREDLLLIGATHEFKQEPLGQDDVVGELRERTEAAVPYAWIGSLVQITEGFRVQSQRGEFGRLPILGKCESLGNFGASTWLFTGLSSRGLLYHGLFGELLSRAILVDDEDTIRQDAPEVLWWKQT